MITESEKISLPKIDWALDALEPYISKEINDLHINKVCLLCTESVQPQVTNQVKPAPCCLCKRVQCGH